MKTVLFYLAALLAGFSRAWAQTPADSSVLRLWLHPDQPFNAPGNGNPLLPGYYADSTIIKIRAPTTSTPPAT